MNADTVIDRMGSTFDPKIHATEDNGKPKYDSTGKFIERAIDYKPPKMSQHFPDSGR
ncbi:MAG: hypothetical protein WAN65_01225 [Candidatus Sulfotelmatobacter sp.]